MRRAAPNEEEIVLSLLRSADCFQRSLHRLLKPFGITATQYNVLRILRAAPAPGLTCTAVGRMMITQEPDVTRLLARMMAQKLVGQYRDPSDQRVVRTQIRSKGIEVLDNTDGQVERLNRELLRELSGTEMARLAWLLRKARICEPPLAASQKGGTVAPDIGEFEQPARIIANPADVRKDRSIGAVGSGDRNKRPGTDR